MASHSIEDYRRRNEDAPLHLVREAWGPVVRLIDGWAKEKIGLRSGYSSEELDDFSRTHRVRFPSTVREWWRLAGRHPFVEPGLLSRKTARLHAPHDRSLVRCRDFLILAVDEKGGPWRIGKVDRRRARDYGQQISNRDAPWPRKGRPDARAHFGRWVLFRSLSAHNSAAKGVQTLWEKRRTTNG